MHASPCLAGLVAAVATLLHCFSPTSPVQSCRLGIISPPWRRCLFSCRSGRAGPAGCRALAWLGCPLSYGPPNPPEVASRLSWYSSSPGPRDTLFSDNKRGLELWMLCCIASGRCLGGHGASTPGGENRFPCLGFMHARRELALVREECNGGNDAVFCELGAPLCTTAGSTRLPTPWRDTDTSAALINTSNLTRQS